MGLRERKKAATREALHEVALRLFGERGYQATTVAEIAAAANVSERTFFRYFRSKEDVALQDATRYLPRFEAAIRERPPEEPPLRALLGAFLTVVTSDASPQLALLYSGPPVTWSTTPLRSGVRLLQGLETAAAAALFARPGADTESAGERRYRCELAARAGVAAFRSALLRYHELGGVSELPPRRFVDLVREAFALLESGCAPPASAP